MKVFTEVNNLPQKIQSHLSKEVNQKFIAGLKTSYKPNATIPLLWLVIYEGGLLFCSTHKSRGIFKNISMTEVDSIRIYRGLRFTDSVFQIIFKNINQKDFVITLPPDINCDDMKNLLVNQDYQVVEN